MALDMLDAQDSLNIAIALSACISADVQTMPRLVEQATGNGRLAQKLHIAAIHERKKAGL